MKSILSTLYSCLLIPFCFDLFSHFQFMNNDNNLFFFFHVRFFFFRDENDFKNVTLDCSSFQLTFSKRAFFFFFAKPALSFSGDVSEKEASRGRPECSRSNFDESNKLFITMVRYLDLRWEY